MKFIDKENYGKTIIFSKPDEKSKKSVSYDKEGNFESMAFIRINKEEVCQKYKEQ